MAPIPCQHAGPYPTTTIHKREPLTRMHFQTCTTQPQDSAKSKLVLLMLAQPGAEHTSSSSILLACKQRDDELCSIACGLPCRAALKPKGQLLLGHLVAATAATQTRQHMRAHVLQAVSTPPAMPAAHLLACSCDTTRHVLPVHCCAEKRARCCSLLLHCCAGGCCWPCGALLRVVLQQVISKVLHWVLRPLLAQGLQALHQQRHHGRLLQAQKVRYGHHAATGQGQCVIQGDWLRTPAKGTAANSVCVLPTHPVNRRLLVK